MKPGTRPAGIGRPPPPPSQARAVGQRPPPDMERSFREEVEEFAAAHDVVFAPKKGLSHDGKPLYSFGPATCYLDQKVIYVLVRPSLRCPVQFWGIQ